MTCEELLQALNQYVDEGDVTLVACEEFAAHLAGCNPCQVVVDNIRNTITLYKAGEVYPLPEECQARLQSVLRQKWQEKFGKS